MRKYSFYLLAIVMALFITSCGDDDDVNSGSEEWKRLNEQAFNEIKNNPEYTEIASPGNEGSIYYKVLSEGDGTVPVYYTSTVKIYSKGWFVATSSEEDIANGDIFQHWLFEDGQPYPTLVSTSNTYLFNGVRVALQHMKKGDKWEIWIPYPLSTGRNEISDIPYYLGFGSNSSRKSTIPGYSTLAFEIEVVEVIQ